MIRRFLVAALLVLLPGVAAAQHGGAVQALCPGWFAGFTCNIGASTIGLTNGTLTQNLQFAPLTWASANEFFIISNDPGNDGVVSQNLAGNGYSSFCTIDPVGNQTECLFHGNTSGGTLTGTIAATVLTVTACSSGLIVGANQSISGAGVTAGTYITSAGTGTTCTGTWNLSQSSTVSVAETMTVSIGGGGLEFSCLLGNGSGLTSTSGCYLPPPVEFWQTYNNAGTLTTRKFMTLDTSSNLDLWKVNGSGLFDAFSICYATGLIALNSSGACAGLTNTVVGSGGMNEAYYPWQFQRGLRFDNAGAVGPAPSPGNGQGSIGSSSSAGLELRGNLSGQFDVALEHGGGAIAFGVPAGQQLLKFGRTFTLSQLPSCSSTYRGALAIVTDATAPTWNATITGGGAVEVIAECNGTNWTSH